MIVSLIVAEGAKALVRLHFVVEISGNKFPAHMIHGFFQGEVGNSAMITSTFVGFDFITCILL